jgi:hypothetical protein
MSDFSVRSDNVDVEQIMRQIRSRIREKRGVDYTEEEIRELANVKLEKFIDPKGVRSNLLEEYRRVSTPEPPAPNYAFGEDTLYETHRGPIRWIRALMRPFLKMLFNPNPLIQALHIQAGLNQKAAERNARREQMDGLHYEVIHNLVVELTRTGVEVKSLKMRLESMASRLDFDERRARALEGVVQYRAGAVPPLQVPSGPSTQDQPRRHDGRRDQQPRHDRQDRGPRPQQNLQNQQNQQNQQNLQNPQSPQNPQNPSGAVGEGNALDNDGNERRARRRRRRGRRRPADRGPAFAGGGSSASSGEASPEPQNSAPAADQPGDRTSDIGPSASAEATADRRTSDSESAGSGASESSAPPDRSES